jgi:predicted GNAT family acetyltransferase
MIWSNWPQLAKPKPFTMTSETAPLPVRHNVDLQRFEVRQEPHLAFLSYTEEGGRVVFDHTFVPQELRGLGVGGALVRAALEEGRKRSWKVVPRCWFVAEFIEKNREFLDLVDVRYLE